MSTRPNVRSGSPIKPDKAGQDAHYHACLSDDHAPGYPCRVKLVGKCPACKNGLAASDSAAAQAALQNG